MKKKALAALVAGLVSVGVGSAIAAPAAHADTTGTNGFDCKPDLVSGGGSDTTFGVMTRISEDYNFAPHARLDLGGTSPTKGDCDPTAAPAIVPPSTTFGGNFDQDSVLQVNPIGSGAGINDLLGTSAYNPRPAYAVDAAGTGVVGAARLGFARSSRAAGNATESTNLQFSAFAQDAIGLFTYGTSTTRPVKKLTATDLANIYSCTVTDWSSPSLSFNTPTVTEPAGTIQPWGMNTNSGTKATFDSFVNTNSGLAAITSAPAAGVAPCVQRLTAGVNDFPFENDVKNISTDPAFRAADALWFGSFGEFLTFAAKRASAGVTSQVWGVGTTQANAVTPTLGNVFSQTYKAFRYLYHVTLKTEADCVRVGGVCQVGPADFTTSDITIAGTSAGLGGGVREFTRFLCRSSFNPSGAPGNNPFAGNDTRTGTNLANQVSTEIARFNFTDVFDNTAGYRCKFTT